MPDVAADSAVASASAASSSMTDTGARKLGMLSVRLMSVTLSLTRPTVVSTVTPASAARVMRCGTTGYT